MPGDELKSAWELALEKVNARDDLKTEKLTEEQKQAIAEIRGKYRARVAELEIHQESRMKEAVLVADYDKVEAIRSQGIEEKSRLNRGMERKIEKVRADSSVLSEGQDTRTTDPPESTE